METIKQFKTRFIFIPESKSRSSAIIKDKTLKRNKLRMILRFFMINKVRENRVKINGGRMKMIRNFWS